MCRLLGSDPARCINCILAASLGALLPSLLQAAQCLRILLYQLDLPLKRQHAIDYIISAVLLHSNHILGRQITRQRRSIGVLCSSTAVVVPWSSSFRVAAVCTNGIVVIALLGTVVFCWQWACGCSHSGWTV